MKTRLITTTCNLLIGLLIPVLLQAQSSCQDFAFDIKTTGFDQLFAVYEDELGVVVYGGKFNDDTASYVLSGAGSVPASVSGLVIGNTIHNAFITVREPGPVAAIRYNAIFNCGGDCMVYDVVYENGDVYAVGYFNGYMAYGTDTLFSTGMRDGYALRLDNNGNLIWWKQVTGSAWEVLRRMVVTGNSVLVTGFHQTNAAFDGIPLNYADASEVTVASMDKASGTVNWVKAFTGSEGRDEGNDIATDAAGNIYVVGRTDGNLLVDTFVVTTAGTSDAFFIKINIQGDAIWTSSFGGSAFDLASAATFDDNANMLFVAGNMESGDANVTGNPIPHQGGSDMYVAALSPVNGAIQWLRSAGSPNLDALSGIDMTYNGDVVAAGFINGDIIVGQTTVLQAGQSQSAVLLRFDSNGNLLSSNSFGGPGEDRLHDVSTGKSAATASNINIAGFYRSTINFGANSLTAAGATDGFGVSLCDSTYLPGSSNATACNSNWLLELKAPGNDFVSAMAEGNGGEIVLASHLDGDSALLQLNQYGASGFVSQYNLAANGAGVTDAFAITVKEPVSGSIRYNAIFPCGGECVPRDVFMLDGEVYVAGYFIDFIDFGTSVMNSTGMRDGFIAKLDSTGNVVWTQQMGGPVWETFRRMTVRHGKVYATGYHQTNGSIGGISLAHLEDTDLSVVCLDAATGAVVWAKGFAGGNDKDEGLGIAVNASGEVFIAGRTDGDLRIGNDTLQSNGNVDAFVAKLDTFGNALWAFSYGGTEVDYIHDMAYDDNMDVLYVGGGFSSSSIQVQGHTLSSAGNNDAHVLAVSGTGVVNWARIGGSSGNDHVTTIDLAANSDILIGGITSGDFVIDQYYAPFMGGDSSVLFWRLDPNGSTKGLFSFGSDAWDRPRSIVGCKTPGNEDRIVISGHFAGTTLEFGNYTSSRTNGLEGFAISFCDSVSYRLDTLPVFTGLGNDTSICADACVTLTAGIGTGYTWWSDNITLIPAQQQVLICPQVGISQVAVSYTDTSGTLITDTIMLTVNALPQITNLTPDTSVPSGSCITLSVDSVAGLASASWYNTLLSTANNGFSNTVCPLIPTTYEVEVISDQGCISIDSVFVDVIPLTDVWPGDADDNGVANNWDILPIGLLYDSTGPVRPNASLVWVGQPAYDWGSQFINGSDYKHTDCNGDGVVNNQDITAILQNYGLTHAKRDRREQNGPLLNIALIEDTVMAGDTATFVINLGQANSPANNVYGLAFSVNYNSLLVQNGTWQADYTNSWLGTIGVDMEALDVELPSANKIDFGITRTDLITQSGWGELARVRVVTIDNISGKDIVTANLPLWINGVRAIDNMGEELELSLGADTLVIIDEASGLHAQEVSNGFKVYPNPVDSYLQINTGTYSVVSFELYNLIGKQILKQQIDANNAYIDVSHLLSGIYTYRIIAADGSNAIDKLLIE